MRSCFAKVAVISGNCLQLYRTMSIDPAAAAAPAPKRARTPYRPPLLSLWARNDLADSVVAFLPGTNLSKLPVNFKGIPRRATLGTLHGRAAAQGARPGPGRVPGRAARGNPRTSLVSRDVDRRIGSVAMRNWYTTLLPTWPQGRHSRIAAAPTPAWYQRRSHRALSSVFSLF